jgi:hypothetical protein
VCQSDGLRLGLDLGTLPLANSFLSAQRAKSPVPEPMYPLRVAFCNNCGLIQLLDVVDKEEMFDEYAFLTATASTSLSHFEEYAREMIRRFGMTSTDLVVDIGSNDGTLLKSFKRHGLNVLGVEPAHNLARQSISEGIPTINEYFGPTTVAQIGQHNARLISANNVVSHVSDLNGFMKSVADSLGPNGLFTFEVPWVVDVFRHYNFDIVYHEHLSYFGFKPLSVLLEKHGLELIDIEYFPQIHGGSLRGIVAHAQAFPKQSDDILRTFREEEKGADFNALQRFATRVHDIRTKLVAMLQDLKAEGHRIVGYGAPAKATILLNYCRIDRSILDFVSDNTPLKQGKFIPGVRIPIVNPEEFHKEYPDYALLLAWNFKDEILQKEKSYLKSGGKFIIPFPEPQMIS